MPGPPSGSGRNWLLENVLENIQPNVDRNRVSRFGMHLTRKIGEQH
jgi:hypothetical protein